jgi:hypothetical protein
MILKFQVPANIFLATHSQMGKSAGRRKFSGVESVVGNKSLHVFVSCSSCAFTVAVESLTA